MVKSVNNISFFYAVWIASARISNLDNNKNKSKRNDNSQIATHSQILPFFHKCAILIQTPNSFSLFLPLPLF